MAVVREALLKVTAISVAVFVGGLVLIGVGASVHAEFLMAIGSLAVLGGLVACLYLFTQWLRFLISRSG